MYPLAEIRERKEQPRKTSRKYCTQCILTLLFVSGGFLCVYFPANLDTTLAF